MSSRHSVGRSFLPCCPNIRACCFHHPHHSALSAATIWLGVSAGILYEYFPLTSSTGCDMINVGALESTEDALLSASSITRSYETSFFFVAFYVFFHPFLTSRRIFNHNMTLRIWSEHLLCHLIFELFFLPKHPYFATVTGVLVQGMAPVHPSLLVSDIYRYMPGKTREYGS